MVTTSPARAMGLEGYGVAVGNKADLVLLDTKVVEHAIIDIPERLYVIKTAVLQSRQTKSRNHSLKKNKKLKMLVVKTNILSFLKVKLGR